MDIVKLSARAREGRGSGLARKKRVAGWIPAVCYSHGKPAQSIEISAREFGGVLRSKRTSHLMNLGLEGKADDSLAVVKELQRDVLRPDVVLHIDFQLVAMNEKITVSVPLEVTGVPRGVKDDGGILEHPVRHLSVRCFPADIPEKIVIDVSDLGINQSVHVRDIKVEKAEIANPPEEVLALVSIPAKEVVVEPVAAAVEGAEGAEGAPAAEGAEGAKPAEGAEGAKGEKGDKGEKAGAAAGKGAAPAKAAGAEKGKKG